MENEHKVINARIDNGTFHPELMDKVMKAVAAYRAKGGDPQKDAAKAKLVRDVLTEASIFLKKEQDEKQKAIELYMKEISGILTADQKKLVAEAGQKYLDDQAAIIDSRRAGGPTGATGRGRGRSWRVVAER
jgi:predicted nucleic-acid-binding protein